MRFLSARALRAGGVRCRLVLAVLLQRLGDRWAEWRSGRTRRWDRVPPPPGARPDVPYVRLRGSTTPIRRTVAGNEYAPAPEPLPPAVAWTRSQFWAQRRREPADPYVWREAPPPPSSLRAPRSAR